MSSKQIPAENIALTSNAHFASGLIQFMSRVTSPTVLFLHAEFRCMAIGLVVRSSLKTPNHALEATALSVSFTCTLDSLMIQSLSARVVGAVPQLDRWATSER